MKKQKMNKGITLIALIITIIVLLILAAVAIAAIKGDGIISHAKNAKSQYSSAQANEQDMLGRYEYELEKAQDKISGSYEQYVWDEAQKNGIVPQGAVYKTGYVLKDDGFNFDESNVVTLNPGDKLPAEPKDGDLLIYGDYMYSYDAIIYPDYTRMLSDDLKNSWNVKVIKNSLQKNELGNILDNLIERKIDNYSWTWYECNNIIEFTIPDNCSSTSYLPNSIKKLTMPNSFNMVTVVGCFPSEIEELYYKGTKEQWLDFTEKNGKNGPYLGYTLNFIIHYKDGKMERVQLETENSEGSWGKYTWTYTAI